MTTNIGKINLEEFEEYTDREIEYIDKFKGVSKNLMEDEEIYDLIIKYNFDDERIREAVLDHVDLLNKKGDEYSWAVVSKGKKQKPKVEEKTETNQTSNFKNFKNKNNNNRRQKFDRTQRNQDQQNLDENQNNNEFTQYRRGNRGNRRGRGNRGNRGGRGGRRNYDRNEFVETHLPSEIPSNNFVDETVQTNDPIIPLTENTNNLNNNIEENTVQENQNIKETLVPDQNTILNNEVNNVENNTILTPALNNNNTTCNQVNEIQNVESFFHKFTLDRENEVNKLLEEKKTLQKEKDPRVFYGECLNHFIRDNNVTVATTFTYKPVVKQTQVKNTINSQPQLTYNQTSTNQTSSSSTNKNFPHKPAFNQHQQNQETPFYSQQPMMNMYPFFYPQTPTDSNMTNPQFFPQMMPPQMMNFMNQFYLQQMLNNQMHMQDPEYLESLKGQKGGKNYSYPSRENMNFMNPPYFNQQTSQGENPNYYKNDIGGDQTQNPNYFYYSK